MALPRQFLTDIERPRFSRCEMRMMLERVSAGPIGFQHLFECPRCDQIEIRVIASDPPQIECGWLARRRTQGAELRTDSGENTCSINKTRVPTAPLAVLP
jgi:hypothetical protein